MNTAQAVHEDSKTGSNKVYKIALTGLFAALSYYYIHLVFKVLLDIALPV